MMDCPSTETFNAFIEGHLSEQKRFELEAHLDTCDSCRRLVARVLQSLSTGDSEIDASPFKAPQEILQPGSHLGRFSILERLGVGGMGTVYAAYDAELDRKIAIKVMRKDCLSAGLDKYGDVRLLREAQAMARVTHPNVVAVHDVLTVDEQVAIAMEFVQGSHLGLWLSREKRSWQEIVAVFGAAAKGLAAAHDAGLVHRDFKPANVLVADSGRVCVTDFGLAKGLTESSERDAATMAHPLLSCSLTRTGAVHGTPAYMAPEQHLGLAATAKSDQYSFCVALHEALYNQRPIEFVNDAAKQSKKAAAADKAESAQPPAWLRHVVLRGLCQQPDARHPSMQAVADALARGSSRRGTWRWVGAAVLLQLGLVGAIALWSGTQAPELCQTADEQGRLIWNQQRHNRVKQAFDATGLPYSLDSFARIDQKLAAYASAWAAEYKGICEATHRHGSQSAEVLDLRMACLRSRARTARALTDVLGAADARVVQNSIKAVSDLKDFSACADIDALRAVVPPPSEEVRERLGELEEALAEVTALYAAGRYVAGIELAKAVLQNAEKLGHKPFENRARFRFGALLTRNGQLDEAETELKRTYESALQLADLRLAGDSASLLTGVVGYRLARFAEGLVWSTSALALIPPSEGARRGRALSNLALVYQMKGSATDAEASFRQGMGFLARSLPPKHPDLAVIHSLFGALLLEQSRYGEAEKVLREAKQRGVVALGAKHPSLSWRNVELGRSLHLNARHRDAIGALATGIAIMEDTQSADLRSLALAYVYLGWVRAALGRYEQAENATQHASQLLEKDEATNHPIFGFVHITFCSLGLATGDLARAAQNCKKGRNLIEATMGAKHPWLVWPYLLRGNLHVRQRQYTAARKAFERALEIYEGTQGYHYDGVGLFVSSGALAHEQGDIGGATERYSAALELAQRSLVPGHPFVADALVGLGRCHLNDNRTQQGVSLFRQALVICEQKHCNPETVGEAHAGLARALANLPKERTLASEHLRHARRAFAELPPKVAAQHLARLAR